MLNNPKQLYIFYSVGVIVLAFMAYVAQLSIYDGVTLYDYYTRTQQLGPNYPFSALEGLVDRFALTDDYSIGVKLGEFFLYEMFIVLIIFTLPIVTAIRFRERKYILRSALVSFLLGVFCFVVALMSWFGYVGGEGGFGLMIIYSGIGIVFLFEIFAIIIFKAIFSVIFTKK